MGMARLIGMMG